MFEAALGAVTTIDGATMAIGLLVVLVMIPVRHMRGHTPVISRGKCAVDLLNGVTLMPFSLMAGSVFSPTLLTHLEKTNSLLIAVAGGIGVFFVVGEILKGQ